MVIATALLTIIGMVGGYLLGQERDRSEPEPEPDFSSSPSLLPAGPACPEQTQLIGPEHGASGELRQVLRVRTRSKMVVWICQDEVGALFYHANRGGTDAEWVENKTALFLPRVRRTESGRYEAEAYDGNRFSVDKERLLITYADGRTDEQKVVKGD
ncbi:hypothetical protein OHA21_45725 [Actinoplanes sp. NBC_00393]|uniref:hypothetical protein n=1 Tax=Actinoplanes sp. NBC_00393 TaxID=2975953 RepID=UPI002E1C532E